VAEDTNPKVEGFLNRIYFFDTRAQPAKWCQSQLDFVVIFNRLVLPAAPSVLKAPPNF